MATNTAMVADMDMDTVMAMAMATDITTTSREKNIHSFTGLESGKKPAHNHIAGQTIIFPLIAWVKCF